MNRSTRYAVLAILAVAVLFPAFSQDADPAPVTDPAPDPSAAAAPAAKPKDGFLPVDGDENWRYEYDVSGFKPGQYNILVRATDSAGNVSFGGPFNIVIDPESDLPVARIANPLAYMRAGADLNVVGTCVDDDGVATVELRLDDGPWTKAEGTDYWSFYLKTADVADGLHTLYARGVDLNGLAGRESSVPFHLDRTKPLHAIAQPAFGTLVSGRLTMSGTVYDANGLRTVTYSTDNGATWLPLKHSLDKKTGTASFSLALDTRKMPDGPSVVWFRSVDGVGSEGMAVFLYFVDNTKPELTILSPAESEVLNGRFTVVGRVKDTIGVASLSWTYGKETGSVELLPGNPYFSVSFEAPAQAGRVAPVFTATDVTGNPTTVAVTRTVEPRADLPVVSLARPAPGGRVEGILRVAGGARDDDGVARIEWRVDAGETTAIETDGAFSFSASGLASGRRVLSVRAVDLNGLPGAWVELPFEYVAPSPRLVLERAVDPSGERAFAPGIALSTMEGRALLSGTVTAANPLSSLSYSINGAAAVTLPAGKTPGAVAFSVPLPSSLPYGVLTVTVTATDAFGATSTLAAPVYALNYSRPRTGPLLDFADAGADAEGTVQLAPGAPLVGAFITPFPGEDLASVSLEPSTPLAAAEFDGSMVRVVFKAEGTTAPTLVRVRTSRGHIFEAGPFTFRTDAQPPALTLSEPAFGAWLKGPASIRASARDGGTVALVEYSLDGGEWSPLSAAGSSWTGVADLSSRSGPVFLELRATDGAGNQSFASTAFMVDALPPQPARLLPKAGDAGGGRRLFAVSAGEPSWSVAKVELGRAGVFEELAWAPTLSFEADPRAGALVLRVTDKAGNTASLDLLDGLDKAAALSSPPALDALKGNVEAKPESGPAAAWTGSDATGALFWAAPFASAADPALFPAPASRPIRAVGIVTLNASFTGLNPDPKTPVALYGFSPDSIVTPLPIKLNKTSGAWEATLKLPARADGPATLWVMVRDAASGDAFTKLELDYDGTAPVVELLEPKGSVPGSFTLVARASDLKGIRSLSWEYGGAKGEFELAPGTGDGARAFDIPAKGGGTLTVRAVDGSGNAGQASVAIVHDTAADAPLARFVTPLDGSRRSSDGTVFVYAQDDDAVASVSLSLDGRAVGAEGPGPLYSLDPGATAPGARMALLTAVDTASRPSARVSASFTRLGEAPRVELRSVSVGKDGSDAVATGSLVVIDGTTALTGVASAPNGLASVEYRINDGAWAKPALASKASEDGSWPITVPLPQTLPYERFTVSLRIQDSLGLSGAWKAAFWRVAPMPAGESTDAEGVYLADSRIDADGILLLAPGETLGALWNGRPIQSLAFVPAVPFMELSFQDGMILATAASEGMSAPAVVRVRTVDGDSFDSRPVTWRVDAAGPELTLAGPAASSWQRNRLTVSGSAIDANGLAELAWSLDGGASWTAFTASAPAAGSPGSPGAAATPFPFGAALDLPAEDGAYEFLVRARDRAGRETVTAVPFWKDGTAPVARLASPSAEDLVNGTVYLGGQSDDAGDLARVEFSPDGTAWEDLPFAPRGAGEAWAAGKDALPPAHLGRLAFGRLVDLAALSKGPEAMAFRFTDKAGNQLTWSPLAPDAPAFAVDIEADKPRVQMQIPVENDVMRADFTVSGMAFDDDGVKEIQYRVDGGEWTSVAGANSFSVGFRLLDTADNEHLFEAFAVDLNGVRGETASRSFRVSREEPVGRLLAPDVSVTNRGVIDLKGEASDANGIKEVWISFDNGNTYNKATGTTSWSYRLDTRLLEDGVHSVYVKLVDGYDTPGFAAGLISVDNTAPVLEITGPSDGDEFTRSLTIGGRVSDAIVVESLTLEITQIGAESAAMTVRLTVAQVFSRVVDVSALKPGWYNLRLTAADRADNRSYQSRNIVLRALEKADLAEIIFPAHGEILSGRFTLDGRIVSTVLPEKASVFLGGQPFATVDLDGEGYFSLPVDPASVADGTLEFRVEAVNASGAAIVSEPRRIAYSVAGPWVDITGFSTGDFVTGRPYLSGQAGWDTPVADKADKAAWAAYQELLKDRTPVKVEVSRDNGRSFEEAKGTGEFRYRLETQEYPNGELRLLVRVTFANGETATRKRIFTVDTRNPEVALVRPSENGRFNGVIVIEGTAFDENGLASVEVVVRTGDKASYEVPGFIQGSFLDTHILGATRFELGLGLSFFEDNVKLQVGLGQGFDAMPTWENLFGIALPDTPPAELSRFGGWVMGLKMLANLAYIPFGYYLGPDWDFFSMSFAMGAAFTYFSQNTDLALILSPPDGKYMILSAVVGQWEFAKFTFDSTFLKSVALYLEGGLVFIPSEASTSLSEFIRPNFAIGVRLGLF